MEVAVNRYLKDAVIGMDVFSTDLIHEKMNSAIYGNYAAKSAIDMALYDIMGKITELPAYPALGRTVQGKSRPELGSRDAGFGCLD